MTLKELNNEDRQEFEEYVQHNSKASKLNEEFLKFQKDGKWVQSYVIRDKILHLREELFAKWSERRNSYIERIDLNKLGIPNDIKEKMNILYVTLFMACDIIESCVMDMNSTIKKADKGLSVEQFNDIVMLFHRAKSKLRKFQIDNSHIDDIMWADKCDDMYNMMQNKAKKLIRYNKEKHGE